jgi:hypothetical protein
MKKCGYCGRENADEATYCRECGTEFTVRAPPAAPAKPADRRDRTWQGWLRNGLICFCAIVLAGLLYLLSLGPVIRYCAMVNTVTLNLSTTGYVSVPTGTRYTVMPVVRTMERTRTVWFPRWVGLYYRPATVLGDGGGPFGIYGSYLRWWEDQQPQK